MKKHYHPQYTTEHRNAAVLQILRTADRPLTPTEIAGRIREPWCCHGDTQAWPSSAPISPVLKRIGAIKARPGKWVAPDTSKEKS